MSEAEKIFQPLAEFWNYFEIFPETSNLLKNIRQLQ